MNFNELSGLKQWGVVVAGGALVTAALYYTIFKSQRDQNTVAQHALADKVRENNELESYRPKLKDMERQVANLKQQLDIERRIVPHEKQVEGFIGMVEGEAQKAGVELRRYTARPTTAKEYYTEMPFDIELDGPYYSMLNFFDRVGKLERIVNMSGLILANTKNPSAAKGRHTYQYASTESVVTTSPARTFFSHESAPAVAGAGAKPGSAPGTVKR